MGFYFLGQALAAGRGLMKRVVRPRFGESDYFDQQKLYIKFKVLSLNSFHVYFCLHLGTMGQQEGLSSTLLGH